MIDPPPESVPDATSAAATAEQVVRESYGRLVAYLASVTNDLAEAEDALSEALAAALRSWPVRGVPTRPDAWLVTVARRNVVGAARRRAVAARALPVLAAGVRRGGPDDDVDDQGPGAADDESTIPDRRLQLLFACAHPAIDPTMRSALMLQTVLGLDAVRIAAAFLVGPATMGQRLVRVKNKIRDSRIRFALPATAELPDRLSAVLDAVYAAYGSGWDDPTGTDAKRVGLATEAIRLGRIIVSLLPEDAEAHGLLALLLHSDARAAARRDDAGTFVPLTLQDTGRWSRQMMAEAEAHLSVAQAYGVLGRYQLLAAIQSVHNRRALTGRTDWGAIAMLYDGLVHFDPTIGVHVARSVAHTEARGPAAGLALLDELPAARVAGYQPYHAARAHCLLLLGRSDDARAAAGAAIALSDDPAVRGFLADRYDVDDDAAVASETSREPR